jgi:hypothetical protein
MALVRLPVIVGVPGGVVVEDERAGADGQPIAGNGGRLVARRSARIPEPAVARGRVVAGRHMEAPRTDHGWWRLAHDHGRAADAEQAYHSEENREEEHTAHGVASISRFLRSVKKKPGGLPKYSLTGRGRRGIVGRAFVIRLL